VVSLSVAVQAVSWRNPDGLSTHVAQGIRQDDREGESSPSCGSVPSGRSNYSGEESLSEDPAHGEKVEGGLAQLKSVGARGSDARRWLKPGEEVARWWKHNSGGD
jgi:hypothetical protein